MQYVKIIFGVEFMSIILLSALIIILDQVSKFIIRDNFLEYQRYKLVGDYFYFTFIKNRGAAFGILSGQRTFFIIITIAFIFFAIYIYQKELPKNLLSKFAVSFLLGGSIANLIDRVLKHYVTDFIAFDLLSFYKLPVINIADIFIFFGVVLLIYELLFLVDRGD